MIAVWMLYVLLTSLLLTGAALAGEHALRGLGAPARGLWVAVMAGSLALAAVPWLAGGPAKTSGATAFAPVTAAPLPGPPPGLLPVVPELTLTPPAALERLDRPLAALWALASLLTVGVLLGAVLRTARDRRHWRSRTVDGHDVLVSEGFGPAVVGVTRPAVVVPEWVLGMEGEARGLVLRHEEEHRRRGDVALLVASAWATALMPWNALLWVQLRRLRLAVELDCDRRVLRQGAPPLTYANLLLRVGEGRGALLTPALAEPVSTLERRIRMITDETGRRVRWTALATAAGAAVLLLAACEVPLPTTKTEVENTDDGLGVELGAHVRLTREAPREAEAAPVEEDVGPEEGSPLVLLDGVPIRSTDGVDMQDVAEISVLRGERAVALYGARARNGAILITSKKDGGVPAEPEAPVPLPGGPDDVSAQPTFTPYTVRPDITNRTVVAKTLEESYPPLLRDAGIGGTANVYFFVDEQGRVRDTRINRSSGHEQLDAAALHVARVMEFTPALNRDRPVPVWISLPITFQVR